MLTHGYGKFLRLFEDKIKFSDPIGLGKELSLYLAVLGEFIAPIFIIIGLKTRFFSIFPIITMYVAAFISHAGDPFSRKEKAILFFLGFIIVFICGPGKYSLDFKIKNRIWFKFFFYQTHFEKKSKYFINYLYLPSEKWYFMYAIVEIAGQQFKVEKDQKLFVHRLNEKEGSKVLFDNVLLLDDGKKIDIGTPIINSASVEAKVINHLKGDKLIVFKKKRRKGYKTKNGHRQFLTELLIEKINEKKTTKAATKKTVEKTDIDSEKKSVNSKSKVKNPSTDKKVKNISKKTVSKKNVQK